MRRHTPIIVIAPLLLGIGVGCTNSSPTPPRVSTAPTEGQKEKDDRDKPVVKEARADTEVVLNDLLAGKYEEDSNFAVLDRKLKGFQSWSIETQKMDADDPRAVNFSGTLKGPRGEATFTALMVKQQNGKWMIGTFSGPNPK